MNVYAENMTSEEFAKKVENNFVILPVGSTEQHGPHLPLSTDSVIAKGVSYELAQKIDGIVLPTLSYGYKSAPLSGGGPLFAGTIDLNGQTLTKLVMDILEEIIRDGAKKIFVMNAHFENEAFLLEAIDLISKQYRDITIYESNWWDVLDNDTIDKIFDEIAFPGWAFEHAAVTETSLMLYFAPELVRLDKMVNEKAIPRAYHKYPITSDIVPKSGVLASAKGSTKEKGELIVKTAINKFVDILEMHETSKNGQ